MDNKKVNEENHNDNMENKEIIKGDIDDFIFQNEEIKRCSER